MSDSPLLLKAKLLEHCNTDEQREFAKMLAEQCAEAELRKSGHVCHLFVPTRAEYEMMAEFAEGASCPKCGSGRVVLEVHPGNFGNNLWLKCYWSQKEGGCDFKQSVLDPD